MSTRADQEVGSVGGPAAAPRPGAPTGPRYGEIALSVVLLGIGLYLLIGGSRIVEPGSANTLGPRFFPYAVGAACVVVAVTLVVRILRGDGGTDDEGEDIDPDAPTSWRAVLIIAVAFLAHALLINVVGWPLAVTAMFGVVAWTLGAGKASGRTVSGLLRPLLAGGIASVVIWLIFVKALGVLLPGGVLLELATDWF